MKILCIGEALIDMICTDTGKSLSEGQNFLKKPGGAPTNVAAAIAALGGQVDLVVKVGNDPFGKQLIEVMQDFGVNTQWMYADTQHFTTFAFVSLMENGERDFVFNRGADGYLNWEEVGKINLDEFSIAHFGSATGFLTGDLQIAYKNLLEKALANHIFISFDPNYRHLLFPNNTKTFIDQSWYFLEHCHFFKVSDEEALLLTDTKTIEEASAQFFQKTKAVFAITLGKEGTLLGLNGTTSIVKSIEIKPVDTTGAGDAFVGAVLYQLSKYSFKEIQGLGLEDWSQIIFKGNQAGARTCEFMGAMEAFKKLKGNF